MNLLDIEVVLLVVVPAFPLLTAMILTRYWRAESTSLHERTLLAMRDFLVASGAAVLALARLEVIELPPGTALPVLATMMLLVSLPSAYWLWLYFRGSFR